MILETTKVLEGSSLINIMYENSDLFIIFYGKGVKVWKDYLLYSSKDEFRLISIDLSATLETRNLIQTEHQIESFAFDLNKSGTIVCVNGKGQVKISNLKWLGCKKFKTHTTQGSLSLLKTKSVKL